MCKEDKGAKSFPLSSPEHGKACPNPQGIHATFLAASQDLVLGRAGTAPPELCQRDTEVCKLSYCRASQQHYQPPPILIFHMKEKSFPGQLGGIAQFLRSVLF